MSCWLKSGFEPYISQYEVITISLQTANKFIREPIRELSIPFNNVFCVKNNHFVDLLFLLDGPTKYKTHNFIQDQIPRLKDYCSVVYS